MISRREEQCLTQMSKQDLEASFLKFSLKLLSLLVLSYLRDLLRICASLVRKVYVLLCSIWRFKTSQKNMEIIIFPIFTHDYLTQQQFFLIPTTHTNKYSTKSSTDITKDYKNVISKKVRKNGRNRK